VRAQRLHQARLANPGLTHNEHGRPVTVSRGSRGIGERRQLGVALKNTPRHIADCKS
jgi:hypothetical protein